MISSVKGKLQKLSTDFVVVEVGGLGIKVFIPASTLSVLGRSGDEVMLHTHFHLREDNMSLYGFATEEELSTFELLLNVSGVGPRAALSILSTSSIDSLRLSIGTGNAEMLTRIPGIGAKTAGRIILELKGKIDITTIKSRDSEVPLVDSEVLGALISLGYSPADAQAALRSLPQDRDSTVEDRILAALRHFANR